MRRAVPVLVASAVGGLLLANFHSTTAPVALPRGTDSTTSTSGEQTTVPTTDGSGQQTIDGADEVNRYGDVQVRVTLRGGRIIDLQALKLPSDRERSAEISELRVAHPPAGDAGRAERPDRPGLGCDLHD